MTKELKLSEQPPGSVLASELKRIGEGSVVAHLRSLERQALSISSVASSQLAATDFAFADVGRLYSERMEGMVSGLHNTLQIAESNIARAASAISTTHSDSIAQAVRVWETSTAAHALQISKAFEQVGRSLDFTKQIEASARSIIRDLNIDTGAATLNLRSMFEEVRASSAMSMLATGPAGSGAALDLNAVREVVEEVVQRYVQKPGEVAIAPVAIPAATPERSVPADYPWEALLKQLKWRALIIVLIIWALKTHAEAVWHVEVERYMNADNEQARTEIVIQALKEFGREYADGLRCTRANLNVRKDPGPDAPIVGHLAAGQPVEVLDAQGPYSYIRYRDPGNDQIHEGWAASSYLVKYIPPSARRKDKK